MAQKIRFCLAFALILFFFIGSSQADVEEGEIVNGIDSNFPPFAYLDSNGNPEGFDIKALEWIAREMGFRVRHQTLDWDVVLVGLREKSIDLIASGMNIPDKAEEEVSYTIPYWTIRNFIVAEKGSRLSVDQILSKGSSLGVLRGANEAEWIEENLIKKQGMKFTLVYYDDTAGAIEDLVGGRIRGIAMTATLAQDVVKKHEVKVVGTFGMPDEIFAYAVRKADTKLLDTLNQGLRKLMASPYWEELKKKYLD